jgi:hypothetical protein
MFMGRHYAYLIASIKHFICMMQQITLAALKKVRKVGATTTEAKMQKVIYPHFDNPETSDEERALIERIGRINKAFGVQS